ncbi:MAG: type II toxin-antitoxin system RelE/ParE family toxin [Gammaproteobacteria bacterium]|jgi:toxin ParE1/3/4|nr:type II toxin-antitoxin system RelE/ParE family toxin [Gammaproteobacteria bacterium]
MLSYKLTSKALGDLLKIQEYTLAQWGTEQSHLYNQRIEAALNLLSEFPNLGKPNTKLEYSMRMYSVASHTIFYRVKSNMLVVHGILHQRMLPHRILTNSDSSEADK